jgi:hypothetical protein
VVPRASITFGEQVQMILETIVGIALNLVASDIPTGGNVIKGAILYGKIDQMNEQDSWKAGLHEESHQIFKDAIREIEKK